MRCKRASWCVLGRDDWILPHWPAGREGSAVSARGEQRRGDAGAAAIADTWPRACERASRCAQRRETPTCSIQTSGFAGALGRAKCRLRLLTLETNPRRTPPMARLASYRRRRLRRQRRGSSRQPRRPAGYRCHPRLVTAERLEVGRQLRARPQPPALRLRRAGRAVFRTLGKRIRFRPRARGPRRPKVVGRILWGDLALTRSCR